MRRKTSMLQLPCCSCCACRYRTQPPMAPSRTCVLLNTKPDAKTRQLAVSGSGCSFLGLEFGPRPATSGGPPLVAGRFFFWCWWQNIRRIIKDEREGEKRKGEGNEEGGKGGGERGGAVLLIASRPSSSRTVSPHPLGASAEWVYPTAAACLAHRSLRAACVPAAPAASRLSGLGVIATLPMFSLLVDATDVPTLTPQHAQRTNGGEGGPNCQVV